MKIGNTLKKKGLCPVCTAKRLMRGVKLNDRENAPCPADASPTPPMGWASWNLFGRNVTEDIIIETADAMKALGLSDFGYKYLNVDDCWMSSMRDENGRLQGDLNAFPSGIGALVKAVNARGLKMGLYTSNGTFTCEDLPSSLYHERTDAETFAEWGIEYFKYDFCHNVPIPTRAPELRGIWVGRAGEPAFLTRGVGDAELRGSAEILTDETLSGDGRYISGLDAGNGQIAFYGINAPEDGDYVLTLLLRKAGNYEKYGEITVNGENTVSLRFPPTRGKPHDGRLQTTVTLKKGQNSLLIRNPIGSRMDSAARQYRDMGKELRRAAELQAEKEGRDVKPICFSICEWGLNRPWKWGASAGNLWRTTPDIRPTWSSIVGIYEWNVRLWKYAGVGHYNDPDMLEVGNGNLTENENRAHFTLWCMMASPLILGNDLRKLLDGEGRVKADDPVYRIITNRDVIALDRDPLCAPCRRISKPGLVDVLVKPLAGGEAAVCLFNKGKKPAKGGFSVSEIAALPYSGLPKAGSYRLTDLWDKTAFVSDGGRIERTVPGRDVLVFRVSAEK